MPRFSEGAFWKGRGRPESSTEFLSWAAARPLRLGGILLGLGAFSVFFQQAGPALGVIGTVAFAPPLLAVLAFFVLFLAGIVHQLFLGGLLQLVVGAPVFEEALKFGPVLLATAWLVPRTRRGRWGAFLLRWPMALAVGVGFGVLEHSVTYADEDRVTYMGRILFHAGTPALTAVTYAVLESARDTRVRWFALAPSVLLHWLNNFSAVFVQIAASAAAQQGIALVWHGTIVAAVYAAMAVIPLTAPTIRAVGQRLVQRLAQQGWARPGPAPAPVRA